MSTPIVALTMPQWGLTMTEGKVAEWLKPEGAALTPGEELVEIETSKITNAMEVEQPGVLRRIVAPAGTTLPVGALLAVIADADVPGADIERFVASFVAPEPATESVSEATSAPELLEGAFGRLCYLEAGSGPGVPVVLLHGLGADLGGWMFTQPALAEGRRTVALDLPGHGGSDKDVGSGDPARFIDAIADALDRLGIERAHLVGHSMGGAIAAGLALAHPDRVASLTLIAPAGAGPEINDAFIQGFVQASRRKDAAAVLGLLVHDPALVSRAMIEDVLRYKRLDGVAEALARITKAWFPGGRQAFRPVAQAAASGVPMQLIWGREDRIIPATQADAAAAERHVLEGAGHLPHMEKAGEVNRLIARFLAAAD
jgi:pyruvate dehydrogenase E2 component (dihydrolipoyllysine-residue acetyltransferase)